VTVLLLLLLLLFLLSLRKSPASPEILCVTPPEISPLLLQRLQVAEPRSFSDSNRYLILFLLLFLAVSVSHLAISVADDVRKSLVVLASTKPVR